MSIKLSFDPSGNIEIPTLILVKRNGDIIGNIQNVQNFVCSDSMEDSNEISFDVDYVGCEVWDELKDWRIVWIPDWNTCYKLHVDLNESSKKTKVLTATHLAEYELSHRNLDEVYINDFTEYDSDPTPTIFFDETKPDYSMMHRLLSGTTYIIEHVDESLKRIQRTFNFTDTSIHSAFQEIAEEINCYFEFDVKRNSDGKFVRTVSAYDLYSYCPNCGHRDEFEGVCQKCGNTEYIINGYGEDTDIFLSVDNFVDENAYNTNCEEIKTCFKLEAGDDDMTAAVINQNPNGTNLLWSIPEEFISDMSEELRGKISEYNEQYDYYYNDYVPNVNASAFNSLVNKYKNYNDELYVIGNLKGFPQLTEAYYQTIDMAGYLEHALMPTIQTSETSAEQQGKLLTSESLSPISVEKLESISVSSASNAVVGMAKVIIDSRYQVKEDSGAILSDDKKTWTGKLIVTTYSDEDDKYTTDTLKVTINENYEEFTKQKIEKALKKGDTENYSITSLFKKDDVEFKNMLKQYALVPLRDSILESCNTCINILIDNGVGEPSTWENETEDLYKKLYVPYTNKLTYIQEEIKVRDTELNTVNDLKKEIEKTRRDIQRALDFKDFLGIELYNEFSVFQIDDTYSNPNFVSTGLSESEIFEYAKEFYEVAQKEIKKASTIKHIISSTVKNIFIMKEFDKWRDKFSIGNWIRIEVNDVIYKLRLLSYEVDFQDYEQSSVNFSDGTVIHNDANIINNTMKAVQSIQASYGTTKNKADNADGVKKVVDGWSLKGMSTATVKLMNDADNQNVVYDQHGLVLRRMDDFTGEYEGIQCKIINSTIAFTTDGWKTVRTAIGRFFYYDPEDDSLKEGYGINAELLVGRMILGEQMGLYNSGGTLKFDQNGLVVTDGKNTFSVNPNNNTNQGNLLVINNGTENVFYVDKNGVLHIKGDGTGLDISTNSSISTLDERYSQLQVDINGVRAEVSGKVNGDFVTSQINQSAEQILISVGNNYATKAELKLTNDGLSSKVSNGDVISSINQSAEQITIDAEKINFNGAITANNYFKINDDGSMNTIKGTIGCWVIDSNRMYENSNSAGYTGVNKYGAGQAFWAGGTDLTGNNASFRVSHAGKLFANDVEIKGIVDATSIKAKDMYSLYVQGVGESTIIGAMDWGGSSDHTHYGIGFASDWSIPEYGGDFFGIMFSKAKSGNIIYDYTSIQGWTFYINSNVTEIKGTLTVGESTRFQGSAAVSGGFYLGHAFETTNTNTNYLIFGNSETANGERIVVRHSSSSARYKDIIKPLDSSAIESLYNIPTYLFKYKEGYLSDTDERYRKEIPGFIVEDWENYMPIAIDHNQDGSPEMWNSSIVVPLMFEMIKNNYKEINELKQRIKEMENN